MHLTRRRSLFTRRFCGHRLFRTCLVKQSESHVVIFLFGLFLLLLLLGSRSISCRGGTSRGGSGSSAATASDDSKLAGALGDELGQALAANVLDDEVEVGLVNLHAHGAEHLLDVGGGDLLFGLGQ